ncbi:hypothetical protein V8G54_007644 [Vigna mungo]|uniref:Uncharacterized protein n=1 Tax=Vigna mungo TaxID=3915 RepID=A0AAQ3P456_VIGMU
MAYAMTESRCNYYYNIIRENNPEATTCIDQIQRQQFTLTCDEGRRWSHLTTNLVEATNSVLKKTKISNLLHSIGHIHKMQLLFHRKRETYNCNDKCWLCLL